METKSVCASHRGRSCFLWVSPAGCPAWKLHGRFARPEVNVGGGLGPSLLPWTVNPLTVVATQGPEPSILMRKDDEEDAEEAAERPGFHGFLLEA